ncbi:MAG: hypothetical protein HYW90_01230 [Candidatus Sungbacteria bacterium]|nr:hypothetical protein [Candidatus Sungbacteria bacterium]
MEEGVKKLPYEENDESFGRWFREAAKDKWESYLKGNEGSITTEERDAMRKFLVEQGTQKEIQTKLDSFGFNMQASEVLREEVALKRPDVKLQ